MDIGEEFVRIDVVLGDQPRQGGAVIEEIAFLDAVRLGGIDTQPIRDEGGHPRIDPGEQIGARRIQRVVQIEDPGADGGERGDHAPAVGRHILGGKKRA